MLHYNPYGWEHVFTRRARYSRISAPQSQWVINWLGHLSSMTVGGIQRFLNALHETHYNTWGYSFCYTFHNSGTSTLNEATFECHIPHHSRSMPHVNGPLNVTDLVMGKLSWLDYVSLISTWPHSQMHKLSSRQSGIIENRETGYWL